MKVSVQVAREQMRILLGAGAEFNWRENYIHGTWLEFNIKSCYADRVETICDMISNDWGYELDRKNNIATFSLFDFNKENTVEKKQLIKVRQWLTRRDSNPIPMRTMECVVVRETARAIQVKLKGHLNPSSNCNHCGRKLTHPVSLMYGLGPICGGHFHINPCDNEQQLKARYDDMKRKMESVTWEGWIPRSQIESMQTV